MSRRTKTSTRPVELLGLARAETPARQGEPLLELGDVDAAALQHRPLGQVELVHGHVGAGVRPPALRPGRKEARARQA